MRGGALPEFRHHAKNPLPIDVLLVDEASMVDLALMTRLLSAVQRAMDLPRDGTWSRNIIVVTDGYVAARGADNRAVLTDVLGLDDAQIDRAVEAGILR